MKKKLIMAIAMAAVMSMTFTGCNKADSGDTVQEEVSGENENDTKVEDDSANVGPEVAADTESPEADKKQAEDTTEEVSEKTEVNKKEVDISVYKKVLDEWCRACDGGYEAFDFDELSGLGELINGYTEPEVIYEYVGYVIYDINKDGSPELLLTALPEYGGEVDNAYAAYGIDSKGEVSNLFYGWARNRYPIMANGKIANLGSGGAAYSVLAVYNIDSDNAKLEVEDYYFTYPKDETTIGVYHNTTEEYDVEASEDVTYSADFDNLWYKVENETRSFKAIPLKEYKNSGKIEVADQKAVFVKEAIGDESGSFNYDRHICVDNARNVLTILATEDVKDLKVLKLSMVDVSDDGKVTYDTEELYSQDVLEVNRPIEIGITFYGDLPEYGISYTTADGTTHQYAVYQSGRDGSIVMDEF